MARKPRAAPKAAPAAATQLPDDGFGKPLGERLDEVAELGDLQVESLAVGIRDMMMEWFKHRPKPWAQMTQDEQKDMAGHAEFAAKRMVRRAVGLIAAIDRPGVLCKLVSYGEADGIKINLTLGAMAPEDAGDAILLLHKNVRKEVMLVSADADGLFGSAQPKVDDDQPALSFESEADGPSPPAKDVTMEQFGGLGDNADLNPDGDQSPAIVDQVSAAAAEAENNSGDILQPEFSEDEPAAVAADVDPASKRFGVVNQAGAWLGNVDGGWGGVDTATRLTEEDARATAEQFGAEARDLGSEAPTAAPAARKPPKAKAPAAAKAEEEGDPNYGVWDPDDKMWLEADKEYWTADAPKAGRWSEVRANQIAAEMGDGAIAQLIP